MDIVVLCCLDNIMAVTYNNQKGGTASKLLCQLAITIWNWCIARNILLTAEYLPGHLNTIVDQESRTVQDRCNWMLNPHVFQKIQKTMGPWREKTNSKYGSSFAKWASWCHQWGRNHLSGSISDAINFLADFSAQGFQYQSLNSYRSAISSVHEAVDGVSVGTHPVVTKLLNGAFQLKPPMPRYSFFWDVGKVLD